VMVLDKLSKIPGIGTPSLKSNAKKGKMLHSKA
jgi:hypothetical protein